jgi:hypothetical protein
MTGFESKRASAQDKLADDQLPDLVDLVMEQIRIDIETGDLTALEELLGHVPEDILKGFLSEETVMDINNNGGKW